MCPTIILDKDSGKVVKMVVGGAGGSNITTATAQVNKKHLRKFTLHNIQHITESNINAVT